MSLRIAVTLALHLLILRVVLAKSPCSTPEGQPGDCVDIRSCQPLMNDLNSGNRKNVHYVRKSNCGYSGWDPLVCCPRDDKTPSSTDDNREPMLDLENNTQITKTCGRTGPPLMIGSHETDYYDFPWTVLLEYQTPNGTETGCGGVVISQRTILTAAHCVRGKALINNWQLTSVRLGEYNIDVNPDCFPLGSSDLICAEKYISMEIDEAMVHEEYELGITVPINDIALIRLKKDIPSNYYEPICLPSDGSLEEELYVAGWGQSEAERFSDIKGKGKLQLVDAAVCKDIYTKSRPLIELGDHQFCAGGQSDKESCYKDSGAPLMRRKKDGSWDLVGIDSFDITPCGLEGWPGVYTKVYDYSEWILTKYIE